MDKTVWLIERNKGIPLWLTLEPNVKSFVDDIKSQGAWFNIASIALKFADKASADSYIKSHLSGINCFASEHSFETIARA